MYLSENDIEILKLEQKIRIIQKEYSDLPNCEYREKLHNKAQKLNMQLDNMIFDAKGNYRKDKLHLINSGCLNLNLLNG